jgi:hypothetical protein
MKITAIEPITCDSGIGGRDWLFVKVTTTRDRRLGRGL